MVSTVTRNALNQWPSEPFWEYVDDAITEENTPPEMANIPRDQLVKAYLQAWLMLNWPAGNC